MGDQHAPEGPQTPEEYSPAMDQALSMAIVILAVILASGATYAMVKGLSVPDWYTLLLGVVVSFVFGRHTAR